MQSGAAVCPECGKAVERGTGDARPNLWRDGRDSMRTIVVRAMVVGVVVVLPWLGWLSFVVWRISLQRRPSSTMFAAGGVTLLALTVAALVWMGMSSMAGTARLFNAIVRVLVGFAVAFGVVYTIWGTAWWGWREMAG